MIGFPYSFSKLNPLKLSNIKLLTKVCGERYNSNLFDVFINGLSPEGLLRLPNADFCELKLPTIDTLGLIKILLSFGLLILSCKVNLTTST